jgi:hypothetical protein
MDFARWGMNGARPRVLDFSDMMLLREAEDFRVPIPGHEHHAHWLQGINHPDMNLIAAAPELLEALKEIRIDIETLGNLYDIPSSEFSALSMLDAAIAKAEGQP